MKHLRLLLALLSLIVGGSILYAQEDVTSTYLQNADLSTVNSGWTYYSDAYKYEQWRTGDDTKFAAVEFYAGWGSVEHTNFKFSQTVTLPAGDYRIAVNAFFREGNDGNGTNAGKAWIFAGETKQNVYGLNSGALNAWSSAGDDMNKAMAAFHDGQFSNAFDFSLEEETNLELGFEGKFDAIRQWCILGPVKLYKYSLEDYLVDYRAKVAEAEALYDTPMNPNVLQALKDAVVEESSFTLSKQVTAAIVALTAAINNAKASAAEYTATTVTPAFYSEIADGDFYIMNAATGLFLGGGNAWGTQASLIAHGTPFTAKLSEGVYTLDSHTYNSATQHYVTGTYVDGDATNLFITAIGGGKYTIATADGSAYLRGTSGNTEVSNTGTDPDAPYAQWYFLTKNDRDKLLASASTENPVEATYYIPNASFSRNLNSDYNENKWEVTADNKNLASVANCAESYHSTFNVTQTISVPNGTYRFRAQGFYRTDSGTTEDTPVFFVGDQTLGFPVIKYSEETMDAAAENFAKGEYYTDYVAITVTDRTLTLGCRLENSTNLWCIWDNFELEMTQYTPVTGVTASIDKEEIEAGSTATITAATIPAEASFNALTYTSSDEAIATVDENGVVTGLGIGSATITVAADEMENFSKIVNVTVTAVAPTALALSEETLTLDATNTTATLTVTPTPAEANATVTWSSSDEAVATVAEGVVTAVAPGTATITAISTVAPTVSATATVTVTFPETEVPASEEIVDGPALTTVTYGENLIKNGAFEYPNNFYSWKNAAGSDMSSGTNGFTLTDDEGNHYITNKTHQGNAGTSSIGMSWPIESGKTYVFGYKTKATKTAGDTDWHRVSLSNTTTDETKMISDKNQTVGTSWSDVKWKFTNTENYAYLVFRARWLGNNNNDGNFTSFDDFYLVEVTGEETVGNVAYATDAIPTANIGDGAFQIKQDAIDAANALVQGTATVAEVEAAYEAVTTLNAPEATQAYFLVFNCEGHTATGNALTLIPNPAQAQGLYGLKYLAPANQNLAQQFYFTHAEGNKFKLSAIDQDGNVRYITTQAEGYGTTWYEGIRTTDDADKAMAVEIRPNGEGLYLLWNTGANKAIAHNGNNNNDMFTNNTANFQFVETTKPEIVINTTAAGWGTTILPFAAEKPADVKVYSVSELDETELTLVEVTALEANKPYIIEGAWNETLTGDAQGTQLSYTEGLLTGVYASQDAPVDSYVMQKLNDKVAFYVVEEGAQPTMPANRAYLTAPSSAKVLTIGGEATGIGVIDALMNGEADIYNAAGVKQNTLQKGLNVVKMSDGSTRKIMVK